MKHNDKRPLSGKVALVTGGSRGIGKWICIALAMKGATVVVNYATNEAGANETVDFIHKRGGEAFSVRANITDEQQVKELLEDMFTHLDSDDGIDIVVNNATGPQPRLAIEQCDWKDYLDQLHFFVKAPLLLTKAVLPAMKRRQSGNIILIGSEVVQHGTPNLSSYVTAKSAMIGMTRSWANELGPFGIRVNLVVPGFIPVEKHMDLDPSIFERYKQSTALRKMGEPADIGNAVAFLAADDSKFITGQCISINGGRSFGI